MIDTKINKLDIGDWITPTLENNWINFSGSYNSVGYIKDSYGFVHLRGLIKGGTQTKATLLFNLPNGFRPIKIYKLLGLTTTNLGDDDLLTINVAYDGSVTIGGVNASTEICLDGLFFHTA